MTQANRPCPICGAPALETSVDRKLYTWIHCQSCGGPFPLSYMARVQIEEWPRGDPRRAQLSAGLRVIGAPWPDHVVFDTSLLDALIEWPSELVAAHYRGKGLE